MGRGCARGLPSASPSAEVFELVARDVQPSLTPLLPLLSCLRAGHEPSLVYTLTRADAEKVAQQLRDYGISAEHYHATLPHRKKDRLVAQWMNSQNNDGLTTLCATVAFGLVRRRRTAPSPIAVSSCIFFYFSPHLYLRTLVLY